MPKKIIPQMPTINLRHCIQGLASISKILNLNISDSLICLNMCRKEVHGLLDLVHRLHAICVDPIVKSDPAWRRIVGRSTHSQYCFCNVR